MKRLLIAVFIGFFSLFGLSAEKTAENKAQEINDETVMEAASTMFTVFVYGAAGMEYGQTPEGISYHEEKQVFSYEKVDLTDLSDAYDEITGTITREGENTLFFEFNLIGGPINSMKYRIRPSEQDPKRMSRPSDLIVNGSEYTFSDSGEKNSDPGSD